MNSQPSTEVFWVSIQLWTSLCVVNSPPPCCLDQNTLLAHPLGLSTSLLQSYNLFSLATLSIPSIGNLSASHLRQLRRVLNKHKQRMEWLAEREMLGVIGLPDGESRESQVLWIVRLEEAEEKNSLRWWCWGAEIPLSWTKWGQRSRKDRQDTSSDPELLNHERNYVKTFSHCCRMMKMFQKLDIIWR